MFNKNIEALKNNRLKETLKNINIADASKNVTFVETLDHNIVFLKNEIPVEETTTPIEYIKSLITDEMKQFEKNDIIISVGFGVGYILDELYSSVKSKIVIYEPDTNFLRFIFETIDLTSFLKDNRVFISDNKEECIKFILKTYLNNDKVEFIQSKVLAIFYQEEMKDFTEELYSKLKNKIVDINTIHLFAKKWVDNIVQFISKDKKYYAVQALKDKFLGKTALVLGAGPSLEDNIEQIKESRSKFTIFAVNKSLAYLEKEGIIPDFAIFGDAQNIVPSTQISTEFLSNITAITDWKTDINIEKLSPKNRCMYFSQNELFLSKYASELNIKLLPAVQSSTILALYSAHLMGFSKIYLCGFDLVFKDNQAYANTEDVTITGEKAVINYRAQNIVQVDTIKGVKANTREDYAIFIESLEELIKEFKINNLYNITDFGALIKGMNYTSFNLINIWSEKIDVQDILNQTKPCNADFRSCLAKEKDIMNNIYSQIMNHAGIHSIIKLIIENTTLLYEYLQFDILELVRNIDNQEYIDKFNTNCILALDKILAIC